MTQHLVGLDPTLIDMVRHLREAGLKASVVKSCMRRVGVLPLPGIVGLDDGSFAVLAKVDENQVLLMDPITQVITVQARAKFESVWTGEVILVAKRQLLGDLSRKFNVS